MSEPQTEVWIAEDILEAHRDHYGTSTIPAEAFVPVLLLARLEEIQAAAIDILQELRRTPDHRWEPLR